jgi:methyl-accepting chemotaxis protein
MQIISAITRQTSQGSRGTARTVEQMVKLSEQLNEALSQFKIASNAAQVAAGAAGGRPELVASAVAKGNGNGSRF